MNHTKQELIQEIIGLSKGHKDYINNITSDYKKNCDVITYYIRTKQDVLSKETDKDKRSFILSEIELNNKELATLTSTYNADLEIARATFTAQVAEKINNAIELL